MYGPYTILRKIGEGGYSNVYLCKDEVGVKYACKTLCKKKNTLERVNREVQVMKKVQPLPHVVKYVDDGENELNYYIIQEWCQGGSMVEHTNNKNYTEVKVAKVTKQILQCLYHMHKNNIIHGDVKTSNILISGVHGDDLDVKLCDFGNSHMIAKDIVQVDSLIGTPEFMAPENLRSIYHRSSDIWSLGVLVYDLMCGRFPFNDPMNINHPSVVALYKSILKEQPSFKQDAWKNISDEAKDFIQLCLQKDYEKRPLTLECLEHPWIDKI